MIRRVLGLILLTFISVSVSAVDKCDIEPRNIDAPEKYFSQVYSEAKVLGRMLCESYGNAEVSEETNRYFERFATSLDHQVALSFRHISDQGVDLSSLYDQFSQFAVLPAAGINKGKLYSFTFEPHADSFTLMLYGFRNMAPTLSQIDINTPGCHQDGKPSCKALLSDLEKAIQPYKYAYVRKSAAKVAKEIARLNTQWKHYLEVSRSQTLLDITLTTFMNREYLLGNQLTGPMDLQWFALHPGLIIENVNTSADGENDQLGVAIEWLGINWWDKRTSPVNIPIGLSLTSIYSDRPDVEDVGHGLMLHLDNSYSIGWASHDGDQGYYVSVDLMKLFDSRSSQWSSLRDRLNDLSL